MQLPVPPSVTGRSCCHSVYRRPVPSMPPPPLSLQSNHPNLHVRPMYISTPPCEPLQNHANVSKHARPCVKHNRNTVKGSAGMHYKQCRFPCATQPPLPPQSSHPTLGRGHTLIACGRSSIDRHCHQIATLPIFY